MNKVTTDIMKLLKVDAATALRIQDEIDRSGFDYSECTQREFRTAVKEAAIALGIAP